MEFFIMHWLDITTTVLGLAYILLEYKASMWLWLVGFVMEVLDIVLYYQSGLYADCGMEFYYLFMTVYGVWAWKFGKKRNQKDGEDTPRHAFQETAHPAADRCNPRHLGHSVVLADTSGINRSGSRRFHDGPFLCRHLGTGQEVSRAMDCLDCRGYCVLGSLLLQRSALQSIPLRPLCHHRRAGLHQMEEYDASASLTPYSRS